MGHRGKINISIEPSVYYLFRLSGYLVLLDTVLLNANRFSVRQPVVHTLQIHTILFLIVVEHVMCTYILVSI